MHLPRQTSARTPPHSARQALHQAHCPPSDEAVQLQADSGIWTRQGRWRRFAEDRLQPAPRRTSYSIPDCRTCWYSPKWSGCRPFADNVPLLVAKPEPGLYVAVMFFTPSAAKLVVSVAIPLPFTFVGYR